MSDRAHHGDPRDLTATEVVVLAVDDVEENLIALDAVLAQPGSG